MSRISKSIRARKKMAEGGEAQLGRASTKTYAKQDSEKGVHTPRGIGGNTKEKFGESRAGYSARASHSSNPDFESRDLRTGKKETITPQHFAEQAKKQHKEKLTELRGMKKPNLPYAEGGEVEKDEYVKALIRKYKGMK